MSIHPAYEQIPELKKIADRIIQIVWSCESGVPPGITEVDPEWREAIILSCIDRGSPLGSCPRGAPLPWIISTYNEKLPRDERLSDELIKERITEMLYWGVLVHDPEQSKAKCTEVYRLGRETRDKLASANPKPSNIAQCDGSQDGGAAVKIDGEWSEPMSRAEFARRVYCGRKQRARDVDPLLKQYGFKPVSVKTIRVRLDKMDAETRRKVENPT